MVILSYCILLQHGALFRGRSVKRARNCTSYVKHQQLKGRETYHLHYLKKTYYINKVARPFSSRCGWTTFVRTV
jgi:hypothetical protein